MQLRIARVQNLRHVTRQCRCIDRRRMLQRLHKGSEVVSISSTSFPRLFYNVNARRNPTKRALQSLLISIQ